MKNKLSLILTLSSILFSSCQFIKIDIDDYHKGYHESSNLCFCLFSTNKNSLENTINSHFIGSTIQQNSLDNFKSWVSGHECVTNVESVGHYYSNPAQIEIVITHNANLTETRTHIKLLTTDPISFMSTWDE